MYTHPNAVRYHEHPIKILRYSAKNVWLLIFSLLRSLRFYPFSIQNLIDWGKGAWFDLLIAALIICFSTFRWYCCSYFFDEDSIHAQSGIFLKQEIEIPFSKIMASVEEHPFYLRSFHAVRLKISTASGNLSESNMSLILYDHDLWRLRPHIAILYGNDGETTAYHTSAWRVFLFSALFSSSSSGASYVAILFLLSRGTGGVGAVRRVSGTGIAGGCYRTSVCNFCRCATHWLDSWYCDTCTLAFVLFSEYASLCEFSDLLCRFILFHSHRTAQPPSLSSARNGNCFYGFATKSDYETFRHGFPAHSLSRVR